MDPSASLAEKVVDQAGDAIIYADRTGMIRRWNRAAATLFGFTAEEALGQSLDLVIPDHLRAAHWRGFDAAMASGALKLAGRPTLTRASRKSGRKLYVEMTFALVGGDSASEGSVAIARDGDHARSWGGCKFSRLSSPFWERRAYAKAGLAGEACR